MSFRGVLLGSILLVAFLLASCTTSSVEPGLTGSQATAVATKPQAPTEPAPTLEPEPEPTEMATAVPDSIQTWESGPVLARMGPASCPDSCVGMEFSLLPDIILYADGRLIIHTESGLQERILSRQESCALLNTVDQSGFFNYDKTAYDQINDQFPRLASVIWLEVNAWESKQFSLHGLEDYLDGGDLAEQADIGSALRDTYALLNQLKSGPTSAYQAEHMAIYIHRLGEDDFPQVFGDRMEWPLDSPTLGDLFTRATYNENSFMLEVTVTGAEAQAIYHLLGSDSLIGAYSENGDEYEMAARVLLPYESSGGSVYYPAVIPAPDITAPTIPLTCTSDDGTLNIP